MNFNDLPDDIVFTIYNYLHKQNISNICDEIKNNVCKYEEIIKSCNICHIPLTHIWTTLSNKAILNYHLNHKTTIESSQITCNNFGLF